MASALLNSWAMTRLEQGQPIEAERLVRRAIAVGNSERAIAVASLTLGRALQAQDRKAEARAALASALERLRAVFGDHHPHTSPPFVCDAAPYTNSDPLLSASTLRFRSLYQKGRVLMKRVPRLILLLACAAGPAATAPVVAQLIDRTMAPHTANEGIALSLAQQVGAGRGDINVPDSSAFIIARDPFRSIRRGRQLFQRKFTRFFGQGPGVGDGAGNVEIDRIIGAGLADSCAACHGRPRGSAGFGGDVVTRPDSRDAPHLFGLGLKEMLADEMTSDLRALRSQAIDLAVSRRVNVRANLSAKGVRFGSLRVRPNGSVDTADVEGVNGDLRVRPFFFHGETISIREFIVGALNAEMGIQVDDPELRAAANGSRVTTPGRMVLDGSVDDTEAPPAGPFDGVDRAVVDHLEFYLLNYFKPGSGERTADTEAGQNLMQQIKCTGCHVPNLTIQNDRRVADVETVFDPARGHLNRLYATAEPRFVQTGDGRKLPARKSFTVRNIYTDFKRHDLGPAFHEREYDGTIRREFLTTPLWGVGSTAPYGHDGRSINLREVILRHGGEAAGERKAFASLSRANQDRIVEFLNSLVLFPPDDTASNLDPGDRDADGYPQFSHGSIRLTVLFNDPTRIE
jgi:hypothetical protein